MPAAWSTAILRATNAKPTIKDVAAHAGVSTMTVSRALRTPEKVAETTRARVELAVTELAYVPDLTAGTLASQRSGLVVVLLPSLRHTGFAATVRAIAAELEPFGYHVLLGDTDYSVTGETKLVRSVLGRRPDGVVFISSLNSSEARDLLRRAQIPVVETWDKPEDPIDMVVGFSHQDCGHALTRCLIDAGYRNIGFLGGRPDSDPRGELRRMGHLAALREAGLDDSLLMLTDSKPFNIADGELGVVHFVERHPEIDALHCTTDMIAFGALTECQRRGWEVPGRIAINGFGDFDISSRLVPSLTSAGTDPSRIGREAAQLLMRRLSDEPVEQSSIDVGFKIYRRESSHSARG